MKYWIARLLVVVGLFLYADSDFGLRMGLIFGQGSPATPNKTSTVSQSPNKESKTKEDRPLAPEQIQFFEKHIRPVLVAHCYKCHSAEAEKLRAKLLLDTREGVLQGGETGKVLVPGKPAESLLLKALRHTGDLKMPPRTKLSDDVIADFEKWIAMGAPDPRVGGVKVSRGEIDIEKGRKFWSFQPLKKTTPPVVKNTGWVRTDIDRFLLAKIEGKGLKPVADANRHALLRRAYFDLIGLPPTPAQIQVFVDDRSPEAFSKVVDELLASKHFGERWGRHWLDVARYAESSGKQVNFSYPHAWRYRDWIISAFNQDKPYDRFITEQLAGDLLPFDNDHQRAEQQIATGFLAIGAKSHVERDRTQFRMDVIDEQIDVTTQAFLGITASCARCHDHKLDPIPQTDYYALAGIFRSSETLYGTIRIIQNNHPTSLIQFTPKSGLAAGLQPLTADERTRIQDQIDKNEKRRQELFKEKKGNTLNQSIFLSIQIATQRGRLDLYEKDGTPKLLAMGMRDRSFTNDSPVYQRGEVSKPGKVIPRGLLQVLNHDTTKITEGSGRRELAKWIVSKDNPLTARVMVNRVWLHLFGRGLVPTPDNFGNAGLPPSHPELLDHLASQFMSNGWSVKKLIREIMLSHAYQLSSSHDNRNYEVDPDNALVWRMSKRRLEAETLRDSLLSVSGQLITNPLKGSTVAQGGDGYVFGGGGGFGRFGGGPVDARVLNRSVYLPVIRNQQLESLSLFDFADPSLVVAERATTSTPAQGLFLLNNPFVIRQADATADRLLAEGPLGKNDDDRIRLAYLRLMGRPVTAKELKVSKDFLAAYEREVAQGETNPRTPGGPFGGPAGGPPGGEKRTPRQAAWAAFCQALMGSADFLYRS